MLCSSIYGVSILYKSLGGVYANCIAWALGIHDWIDPIQYIDNLDNLSLLENRTENFLYYVVLKYNTPEKSSTTVFNIINNIDKVICVKKYDSFKDEINIDGTVAFYFNDEGMTHAARYIKEFKGREVNTWSSKLGHNLMISHELDDLSGDGSLYGDPLCYAIPVPGIVDMGEEL